MSNSPNCRNRGDKDGSGKDWSECREEEKSANQFVGKEFEVNKGSCDDGKKGEKC
jgi:hypothetical protein